MAGAALATQSDIEATGAESRAAASRERFSLGLLLVPALLLMAGLVLAPMAWLAATSLTVDGSFSLANYARVLTDAHYARSFWLTLHVSFTVTVVCAVGGYVLAYGMTLMPGWLRAICLALITLPFWTSVLVRTYAWLVLLQHRGLVNKTLLDLGMIDAPLRLAHNLTGTLIGMIHLMLPFMVFPLYAALRRIDPELMKAARGLGARPMAAFWRVYFPLSIPGLAAGSVLVFILCLGFYVTPALLGGGRIIMMALVIERDVTFNHSWGPASASAILFVAGVMLIFAALGRFMSLDRVFSK